MRLLSSIQRIMPSASALSVPGRIGIQRPRSPLARLSDTAADAAIVATLRTALLVAGALLLAWAGGARRFVEAAWLVYPLLVVIGVKLLFEDLRAGRPATLFLAFALYGAALIVGPRLKRRGEREPG